MMISNNNGVYTTPRSLKTLALKTGLVKASNGTSARFGLIVPPLLIPITTTLWPKKETLTNVRTFENIKMQNLIVSPL